MENEDAACRVCGGTLLEHLPPIRPGQPARGFCDDCGAVWLIADPEPVRIAARLRRPLRSRPVRRPGTKPAT